jgi:hypothetical protein
MVQVERNHIWLVRYLSRMLDSGLVVPPDCGDHVTDHVCPGYLKGDKTRAVIKAFGYGI